MGKGKRVRAKHAAVETEAPSRRLAKAARRTVKALSVITLAVTVVVTVMQLLTVSTIQGNLAENRYTQPEINALTGAVPLGQIGAALLAAGALLGGMLLLRRRWKLSLIGTGLTAAGGLVIVRFAVTLGEVFAYNAMTDRGLRPLDLLLRHYCALAIPSLLIIATVFAVREAKNLVLAEMVEAAQDDTPTISLGNPEE